MNKRISIFSRDFYTCQKCGKNKDMSQLQVAHRIRQGKGSEKYIKEFTDKLGLDLSKTFIRENIINHESNMTTTCSLECNASFNIFFKPLERDALLLRILEQLGKKVDTDKQTV
jgi:hypothetical protein